MRTCTPNCGTPPPFFKIPRGGARSQGPTLQASLTGWARGPSPSGPWVGEGDGIREEVLVPGREGALGGRQLIARARGLLGCFQQENLGRRRAGGEVPGQARDPRALGCVPHESSCPKSGVVNTAPLAGVFPPPLPSSRPHFRRALLDCGSSRWPPGHLQTPCTLLLERPSPRGEPCSHPPFPGSPQRKD